MSTSQILIPLFVVILAGFLAGKAKLFDDTGRRALAKFVFYIATSALIINALLTIDLSDLNKFPRFVFANSIIASGIFILVYLLLRLVKLKYKTGASTLYAGNVANNVYLGLPLIKALYGAEGLIFAVAFLAIPMTVTDVVDFYVLSKWRQNRASVTAILRDLARNPVVVSTFIGVILVLLRVKLPSGLIVGLNYLAVSATGLALFAMGLFLSFSSWRYFKLKDSLITSAIKLGLVPALTYVLAKGVFGLQGTPLFVSVMMAAMPSAIFCMIVASEYEFDERATADAILLSTVLFLFTSVFWSAILR